MWAWSLSRALMAYCCTLQKSSHWQCYTLLIYGTMLLWSARWSLHSDQAETHLRKPELYRLKFEISSLLHHQLLFLFLSLLQCRNQVSIVAQQGLMGSWRRPCMWLNVSQPNSPSHRHTDWANRNTYTHLVYTTL